MSNRLRSLDSKISFFAFADIITAVSGVLIFVALLLATDLGRPTDSDSQAADSELEQRLQETLAQQVEVDAQNHRWQELIAIAQTAPDSGKLQADITILRSQLFEEQKKLAALAAQMTDNHAAIAARDEILGLNDLKGAVHVMVQETEFTARENAKVRSDMENLDQKVAQAQSKLLKLHQREGQLWLLPDKSETTKEPILVTVSGVSVTLERFDHPDERKQLKSSGAADAFKSYLRQAKALDQYVVFLIRPSGIEVFQDLVKSAREMGFEVGFDALEENRQIHFSTPPSVDESPPPIGKPVNSPPDFNSNSGPPASATPPKPNKPLPAAATNVPVHQKVKSWWQKLLEWVGLG